MRHLHARASEGGDITEDRTLFAGIDRYEQAVRKVDQDNAWYQGDVHHARKITLHLPNISGAGRTAVDGLIVVNPHSFLFKEWARRDRGGSPLGRGFSFVFQNFLGLRYSLAVDPAAGVNLRGLAEVINSLESRAAEAAGTDDRLRWYGGECPFFNHRLVVSPTKGRACPTTRSRPRSCASGRPEGISGAGPAVRPARPPGASGRWFQPARRRPGGRLPAAFP